MIVSLLRAPSASPLVTLPWLADLSRALAIQRARDVAPAWAGQPGTGSLGDAVDETVYESLEDVPAERLVLQLLGELPPDLAGDLAAHYPPDSMGRILAPVRTADLGLDEISIGASHEVTEADGDPTCDIWILIPGSSPPRWILRELCDPVQDESYKIRGVALSNFVRPAFFGIIPPRREGYPFDYIGALTAPFTRTSGGYYITRYANGTRSQVPAGARVGRRGRQILAGYPWEGRD